MLEAVCELVEGEEDNVEDYHQLGDDGECIALVPYSYPPPPIPSGYHYCSKCYIIKSDFHPLGDDGECLALVPYS